MIGSNGMPIRLQYPLLMGLVVFSSCFCGNRNVKLREELVLRLEIGSHLQLMIFGLRPPKDDIHYDWWMCPESYLRRRPFDAHGISLDALMEAKAKQGVQGTKSDAVFVLFFPETFFMWLLYSKRRLLSIHENVKVLRYPDHFSTGVYLWSHHEKLVIVDYRVGFIGDLDLCFGWYDTPSQSKVSDLYLLSNGSNFMVFGFLSWELRVSGTGPTEFSVYWTDFELNVDIVRVKFRYPLRMQKR
ncbi:hypothetical protein IFM89_018440 [Coptis chinensis]|uniref:phospholipase D n=1 Tax=Coptis chinensis TaxID=261450 RepID=A0A835HUY1_9MAGN|nr:hypothetical protein IFM89_018440 [Coptis chinensis]